MDDVPLGMRRARARLARRHDVAERLVDAVEVPAALRPLAKYAALAMLANGERSHEEDGLRSHQEQTGDRAQLRRTS